MRQKHFLMIIFNKIIQLAFQLSFDKNRHSTYATQLRVSQTEISLPLHPLLEKGISHTQPREFKFLLSRVSQNFSRNS